MTDIKSKSHLDALKSARMFIAFIGAIIFMIFTYYEIPVNISLLFLIIFLLSYFMYFGVPLSEDVIETLRSIEKNTRREVSNKDPTTMNNPVEEEAIRTTGGGAFAGMVTGCLLGLTFGPVGVGGILGALAGNQIEYESKRMERERRRRKLRM